MHILEWNSKYFVCEVCGESTANPTTMGIQSDKDFAFPVQLCRFCGPLNLDLMQLCCEVTIGCTDN